MIPVKITIPLARLVLASKILDPNGRVYDVETLEERRRNLEEKWQTYKNQISRAYNKKVTPRTFTVGDLVLKAADTFIKIQAPPSSFLNGKVPILF